MSEEAIGPSEKYNPRLLALIAGSPNFFRRYLPQEVLQLADYEEISKPVEDTQAKWALEQMRKRVIDMIELGPLVFRTVIYENWAKMRGLNKTFKLFGSDFEGYIPAGELDESSLEDWKNYLALADIPREQTVQALRLLNPLGQLPSTKHIFSPIVQMTEQILVRARYQIVERFLPDITDEEAKQLFEQRTTAEEVHKRARSEIAAW